MNASRFDTTTLMPGSQAAAAGRIRLRPAPAA